VIGVVGPEAQAAAAQARPGTKIRFAPIPMPHWSRRA
jgi:allophanate hydrolase subunit 2